MEYAYICGGDFEIAEFSEHPGNGFYPVDSVQPVCLDTEYLSLTGYVLGDDGVVHPTYAKHTFTAEQLAAMRPRDIRDWEFRNRFNSTQLVGIMRAGIAGDDIAMQVWLQLSTASDGVNLDDPATVAGVGYVAMTYPELAIDPAVILA